MMSSGHHLLEAVQSATSISDEIAALEAVRTILVNREQKVSEDPEEEWLSLASSNLGDDLVENPFPRTSPESLFPGQTDLNQFTCYVFKRRFGWSEATTNRDGLVVEDRHSCRDPVGNLPHVFSHGEHRVMLKNKLNEILDEFVKWFSAQPVTRGLLQSFRYTIAQAGEKPVVRNQTVVHSMEWLKINKSHANIHINHDDIISLLMTGLTDIWSAIRKACVSRLPGILESFTIKEAEMFFTLLAQICRNKESSWQSIEGALMAINSLLRRFQWIGRVPIDPFASGSVDEAQYFIRFGKEELSNLPPFITSQMHSIAYPLLAHPQLSVREYATKAFTSFLSRCEFQEALASFSEAISRLSQGTAASDPPTGPHSPPSDQQQEWWSLPHHAVLRKDFQFLNAYEAEGLLGVCLYLIKHIPPGFLLPKWPFYFSVFSLYLMHPASTVRQATSELFRYLVAKDCNNSTLLKLVLQGLSAHWSVNMKYMLQPAHSITHFHPLGHHRSNPTAATIPSPRYQMLDKSDCSGAGAGGRARSSSEAGLLGTQQANRRQPPFYSHGKSVSIVQMSQLEADGSIDSLLCRAWEWREGRLFAYELITKFLLVNHIHYLFPSFAMPQMKFNGAASTDESITPSHKASRVPQGKPPVQKSLSHGGTTLRQAWLARKTVSDQSSDEPAGMLPHDPVVSKKPPTPPPSTSPPPLVARQNAAAPCKQQQLVQQGETFTRTGSERRKKSVENKRSQTMAEGSFFNQPMTKHYSFPTNPDGPHPGDRRPSHGLSGTLSLLGLTHDLDKKINTKPQHHVVDSKACLQGPIKGETNESNNSTSASAENNLSVEGDRLLKAYLTLANRNKSSLLDTQLPWLAGLQLESLTNILNQMLLQTVNSLASSRWELRRMSHQALPLVAECLRWYHPQSLVEFWNQCLKAEASLACYGAAITLKYSIQHANRMMQFLQQPPSSWRRDSESCRDVSASIVVAVTQGLPGWASIARQLLEREVIDKLSVVAMEILLLTLTHFEEEVDEEKVNLESAIHRFQMRIFSHAHSQSAICMEQSNYAHSTEVIIPLDGFLCCCLKDESSEPYGTQLERYMLRETHCMMLDYLRQCSPLTGSRMLPLLLSQLLAYQEDEDITKTLLDGCCLLVTMVKGHITENGNMGLPKDFSRSLELALDEIALLIRLKTLELSMLRQVLEMYQDLSLCTQSSTHLQTLFAAITSRLDLVVTLSLSALNPGNDEDEDGMGGKMVLFASNDIPASPVDIARISDDDDEDEEDRKTTSSHPLSESLALNASSGSGHTPRLSSSSDPTSRALGVSPTARTDVEDDDSDWDSWDEDEEDQSVFQEAVADFLRQLQGYLGPDTFHAELTQASDRDRQFIRRLLSS